MTEQNCSRCRMQNDDKPRKEELWPCSFDRQTLPWVYTSRKFVAWRTIQQVYLTVFPPPQRGFTILSDCHFHRGSYRRKHRRLATAHRSCMEVGPPSSGQRIRFLDGCHGCRWARYLIPIFLSRIGHSWERTWFYWILAILRMNLVRRWETVDLFGDILPRRRWSDLRSHSLNRPNRLSGSLMHHYLHLHIKTTSDW